MTVKQSNVDVQPNVMLADVPSEIPFLPGDFAFQVYRGFWRTPQIVRRSLTVQQWVEYEQYLICRLCGRPCAGTCGR